MASPNAEEFGVFGEDVDLSGGVMIVGARGENGNAGVAYLLDASTGAVLHTLAPGNQGGNDWFGVSVAIDGNLCVVGALNHRFDGSLTRDGAAFVFTVNDGQLLTRLDPLDPGPGTDFGYDVQIDGQTVIVGARLDDELSNNAGAAYLFDATTGQQLHKLTASDPTDRDALGSSVAVSGGLAVVGAINHDGYASDAGAVYVFDVSTGDELRKLDPGDLNAVDQFGISVAIDGTTAVVGAYRQDTTSFGGGAAYAFNADTGAMLKKWDNPAVSPQSNDNFGSGVAIADGSIAIGAFNDDVGASNSGTVYLFTDTFITLGTFTADDATNNQAIGRQVAISGEVVVTGAANDGELFNSAGAAYAIDLSCPADLNGDRFVDNGDIGFFVGLFLAGDPAGDINEDGVLDNGDISAFVGLFLEGC